MNKPYQIKYVSVYVKSLMHNQAQISREMGIAARWVIYYFRMWHMIFLWKFRDGCNLSVAQNFWKKVILECLILY